MPEQSTPKAVLESINTILHERQLEEYYLTLCYAVFDLKRRTVTLSNSGVPYPIRATADNVAQIESPGVPLGSFYGSTYDEIVLPLGHDDVFVFCSDGASEAMNRHSEEFTSAGIIKVVEASRTLPAREIVHNIINAVEDHRAGAPPNDDMTVVALRIA